MPGRVLSNSARTSPGLRQTRKRTNGAATENRTPLRSRRARVRVAPVIDCAHDQLLVHPLPCSVLKCLRGSSASSSFREKYFAGG